MSPRAVVIVANGTGHNYSDGTMGFVTGSNPKSAKNLYQNPSLTKRVINRNGSTGVTVTVDKDFVYLEKGNEQIKELIKAVKANAEERIKMLQYIFDTGELPPTATELKKAKAILETIKAIKADDEDKALSALVQAVRQA